MLIARSSLPRSIAQIPPSFVRPSGRFLMARDYRTPPPPRTHMLGMLIWYSSSSNLSSNTTLFSPSMIVAAELPKNLDLGLSSP